MEDVVDGNDSLELHSNQTGASQRLSDTTSSATSKASMLSPLCAAALEGSLDLVRSLLQNGADANLEDKNKQSDYVNALQAASAFGNAELVNLLLDFGADVNAQGGFRGNALQVASFQGFSEIVSILLEHGADVNADDGV
jgi:ankyrin repeat protein